MILQRKFSQARFVTNYEQRFPRVLTGEYRILETAGSVLPEGMQSRRADALVRFS